MIFRKYPSANETPHSPSNDFKMRRLLEELIISVKELAVSINKLAPRDTVKIKTTWIPTKERRKAALKALEQSSRKRRKK